VLPLIYLYQAKIVGLERDTPGSLVWSVQGIPEINASAEPAIIMKGVVQLIRLITEKIMEQNTTSASVAGPGLGAKSNCLVQLPKLMGDDKAPSIC
jgi:hypothetical protein